MITYTFNTVAKLLLIMAPLIIVSGCATIADPGSPASQAAANIQAEPAPERLVRYCRRMAETKNLRIAIGICERALAAAPENPEPVIILAEAYLEAEHRAEAAEAYRYALSIDGQSGKAHFGLGKLYLRDSRLEEARPHLEAALHNGEQDPAIFNALGVLEDQSGNHASAQAFYEAGLELDPDNTALANNYGVSVLLSKPSEIGNNIFGQLTPKQDLNERSSVAETQKYSSALGEKKILPLRQPTQPAISKANKLVTATTAVPALMQTPDETLFSFFMDSQSSAPNTMDPVITPAPVEIVDFQALAALPAPTSVQVEEEAGDRTVLARALQDYNPVQTSAPAKPSFVASSVIDGIPPSGTADISSIDLATVNPGRNPFFQSKTEAPLLLNTPANPVDSAPVSPAAEVQIAEIPHLPIEMPRVNDTPRSSSENTAVPSDVVPEENHAEIPLQADLLVFDAYGPLQAAITKNALVPGDIVTDQNFPAYTTGLSLLQQNEEIGNTFGPGNAGQSQIAIHHDGIAAPSQPDFQGDAKPGSNDPETDPLLWPNSLAERSLPLNQRPSPDKPETGVLAMMLLNRNALSTV